MFIQFLQQTSTFCEKSVGGIKGWAGAHLLPMKGMKCDFKKANFEDFFPRFWFSFQQKKHERELPARSTTGTTSLDDKQGMDAGARLASSLGPYCSLRYLQWRTYKHVVSTVLSMWQTVHLFNVPTDKLDWLWESTKTSCCVMSVIILPLLFQVLFVLPVAARDV